MTHFGSNLTAICEQSSLLVKSCTMDLQAVTCPRCLWAVMAQAIAQLDVIANRIRVVTEETRVAQLPSRELA